MKKKMIYAAIAGVSVISGYMGYSSVGNIQTQSALAFANIEALTGDNETVEATECTGSKNECARISTGNTVHIFYKD